MEENNDTLPLSITPGHDPELDGPISLPKLALLSQPMREALRYAQCAGSVRAGQQVGAGPLYVGIGTLRALERRGLLEVERGWTGSYFRPVYPC